MANITPEQARQELARRRALREYYGQSVPGSAEMSSSDNLSRAVEASTQQTPTIPEVTQPGPAESFARGAVQGATFGFADELHGVAKALGMSPPELLGSALMGPMGGAAYASIVGGYKAATDPESIARDYRTGRDDYRGQDWMAKRENPAAFLGGEVAGGIATAALPGGVPAKGLAKVAALGAATGAAAGLGSSEADLTQGDVSGAVKDTAIGGASGLVAAPVLYGASKLAAAGATRLGGARAAARTAARNAAEEVAPEMGKLEAANFSSTRADFSKRSEEIAQEASDAIGEKFAFSPDQSTGSPSLALAKQKAWNSPTSMDVVQPQEAKRLDQAARFSEMMVDKMASTPELRGRVDVADRVAESINARTDKIQSDASAMFENALSEASRITQNARVVPTSAVYETLGSLKQEYRTAGKAVRGAIDSALADVQKYSGPRKKLSIEDVNGMLKYWGSVAAGKRRIDGTLSPEEQRMIGGKIKESLLAGLDALPDKSIPGQAKNLLLEARSGYAAAKSEIAGILNDSVSKLLGKQQVAGESAIDTLLRMHPSEVKSVMRVVSKIQPELAGDLRAQFLEAALEAGGKASRESTVSSDLGMRQILPGKGAQTIYSKLRQLEPQLMAAFAGDKQAEQSFRTSLELWQRLAFGANIKGSPTYSLFAQDALDAAGGVAAKAASNVPGGAMIMNAGRLIKGVMGSNKALAKLYSTPGATDLFNEALQAQISGRARKGITANAIVALSDVLGLNSEQIGDNASQTIEPEQSDE